MATKRTRSLEPTPAISKRRRVEKPCWLLEIPQEMLEEILSWVLPVPGRLEFCFTAPVCKRFHHTLRTILVRRWNGLFYALKNECRERDWRLPSSTFAAHLEAFKHYSHALECHGISRLAQFGRFHNGKAPVALAPDECARKVFALFSHSKVTLDGPLGWHACYWRDGHVHPHNKSFANLFAMIESDLPQIFIDTILNYILPGWAAIDVDDAIVVLFFWISVYGDCFETHLVRKHLVQLIWEKKLGRHLERERGVMRILLEAECASFWIRPFNNKNPVAEYLLQHQ
jgi:hypothetical protein